MLVLLKNVFDKSVKSIKFLKPGLLSAQLFNILCDKIAIKHEIFFAAYCGAKNNTCVIDLRAEIAVFIYGTPLLFERMTDRQTTIIQEVMADTFMKKNKVSGSFQGKQLIIFVPVIKSKFLWKKLEFRKTCISFCERNSFLIVKPFLMRLILTKCDFKMLYNEMCPHLKDLQTQ